MMGKEGWRDSIIFGVVVALIVGTVAFLWQAIDKSKPAATPTPTPTVTVTLTPSPAPTVTVTATPVSRSVQRKTVAKKKEPSAPKTVKPSGGMKKPPSTSGRDVTVGLTKSQRQKISLAVWFDSPTAKKVRWRESGGRCDAVNPTGKYRGRWQMDSVFWRVYGGLKYASTPDRATCAEQDQVAYRGWIWRGWSPWTTA